MRVNIGLQFSQEQLANVSGKNPILVPGHYGFITCKIFPVAGLLIGIQRLQNVRLDNEDHSLDFFSLSI